MVPIMAKVHIIIGFEAATRFPGTWVGISIDLPPRLAGNLLGVRCSSSWQQSLGTPPGCGGLREAVYNKITVVSVSNIAAAWAVDREFVYIGLVDLASPLPSPPAAR